MSFPGEKSNLNDPQALAPFLRRPSLTLHALQDPVNEPFILNKPLVARKLSKSVEVITFPYTNNDNDLDPKKETNFEVQKHKATISSSASKKPIGWRRYLGMIYTLLSVNMIALNSTIMKKYSHIHPFNCGIFASPASMVVTSIAIVYTVAWEKKSVTNGLLPLKENKKFIFFMFLRAILSSVISYISIVAFSYVSAADVRTVVAAAVITVYIFGWMFLGEKCGVIPIVVALVALCGIGIMTRPPALTGAQEFDRNTLIGIGLTFAAMIVISMQLVIIRYLNKIHHGVLNLVAYVWAFTQGLVLSHAFGVFKIPERSEILGLSVGGIFLALCLAFLVLALQQEEAGVVALIRTSEVIFVFMWQMVIVGTYPDLISVSGAALVIFGVIAVRLRKWVSSLPNENNMKQRLAFLLL